MPEQVFIAGATTRSAAQSARRAGWEVAAADLFGDRDLLACGEAHRVSDYPNQIVDVAQKLSPRKWIYTGGLENAPHVVAGVSQYHDLLGNPPNVLRQVRDPWTVQQALSQVGLLFPDIRRQIPIVGTGKWLRKPRNSCGGTRISGWTDGTHDATGAVGLASGALQTGSYYFQQYVRGGSYGAVYVAAEGAAKLLGVTRQLAGCGWAGDCGYLYVGSVGPLTFDGQMIDQFQRVGACLAGFFGLRGLFGVDAIVEPGRVWTIEVNPRFTASVEIHERATGLCAVKTHWSACHGSTLPVISLPVRGLHGKAVVYAKGAGEVSEPFCRWVDAQNDRRPLPQFADLPQLGTQVAAGDPILTVLVLADRARDVYRQLRTQTHAVYQAFDGYCRPT